MSSATNGRMLGRYELEECLGKGGTGVVHAAWDPRLSRRVAIKLVHAALHEISGDARLMREARALARVRHPNVIEIYDVGVHHDGGYGVYLVMELVRGLDGHRWLRECPRGLEEILAVFFAAARGLAAAHEAGVLHRDFKPANMLVGADDRVRVLDFGLARAIADDSAVEPSTQRSSWSDSGESSRWFAPAVTHDGLVMGTPSFMAPEQHRGAQMDVRTDVYNFCASLWLALCGEMPFAGKSASELAIAKRLAPAPPRDVVPETRALFEVLTRGLAPDPADRFGTMDALVHALVHARRRRRTRSVRVAVGAAVVVLAGSPLVVGREVPGCEDGHDEVGGAWTSAARTRVRAAIDDDVVASTTIAEIDAWATTWSMMRLDACAIPTPTDRDRVLGCLRRSQHALDAAVAVLAESDADGAQHAWRVVSQLPAPSTCTAAAAEHHAEGDAQSDAVAEELVAVRTLVAAGRLSDAQERLLVAESAAARIESAALAIDVEMTKGDVLDELALHGDAAAAYERAYLLAIDAALDTQAADAATQMVLVFGAHDPDANADAWVRRAEAALTRLGPDPARESRLHSHVAGMHATRGEYEQALVRLEAAERSSIAAGETDAVGTALQREKKGRILAELGELEGAAVELEISVAELERSLGGAHPILVTVCSELGHVRRKQGRLDEALALYERSFAILAASEEPDHPELALAHNNLAIVNDELERWSEAVPHYELALAVIERHHGADHPWAGALHHNLGINLAAQDRYDQALARFAHARAIWEPTLGADHPEVGKTWLAQGEVHAARGELDHAIADFEQAIGIFEAALGADHPELVPPLLHLALVLARRDDEPKARALAVRALAIATRRLGDDHPKTARALAVSSLFATDRERARVDAQRAAQRLADVPGERAGLGLALLVQARTAEDDADARSFARAASETLGRVGPGFTRWADEADRRR